MKEVFTDCLQGKSENVRLLQSLGYVNHSITISVARTIYLIPSLQREIGSVYRLSERQKWKCKASKTIRLCKYWY